MSWIKKYNQWNLYQKVMLYVGLTTIGATLIGIVVTAIFSKQMGINQTMTNSPNGIQTNGPLNITQIDNKNLIPEIKLVSKDEGKYFNTMNYQISFSQKPLGNILIEATSSSYSLSSIQQFVGNMKTNDCNICDFGNISDKDKNIQIKCCKYIAFTLTPFNKQINFNVLTRNNDVNISVQN